MTDAITAEDIDALYQSIETVETLAEISQETDSPSHYNVERLETLQAQLEQLHSGLSVVHMSLDGDITVEALEDQ